MIIHMAMWFFIKFLTAFVWKSKVGSPRQEQDIEEGSVCLFWRSIFSVNRTLTSLKICENLCSITRRIYKEEMGTICLFWRSIVSRNVFWKTWKCNDHVNCCVVLLVLHSCRMTAVIRKRQHRDSGCWSVSINIKPCSGVNSHHSIEM